MRKATAAVIAVVIVILVGLYATGPKYVFHDGHLERASAWERVYHAVVGGGRDSFPRR